MLKPWPIPQAYCDSGVCVGGPLDRQQQDAQDGVTVTAEGVRYGRMALPGESCVIMVWAVEGMRREDVLVKLVKRYR